jgi:hypothetical protein
MDRIAMGDRMEFEPELAVRLVWDGVSVVNRDTQVRYYHGCISHFDVLWYDLRLAWLYMRLALRMPMRARGLLAHRVEQPR